MANEMAESGIYVYVSQNGSRQISVLRMAFASNPAGAISM
jgi:hypothetical protein